MSDQNEGGSSSAKEMAATVGVGVVQTAMFIYDFLTFPIYYAAQRPWTLVDAGARIRADVVSRYVSRRSNEIRTPFVSQDGSVRDRFPFRQFESHFRTKLNWD